MSDLVGNSRKHVLSCRGSCVNNAAVSNLTTKFNVFVKVSVFVNCLGWIQNCPSDPRKNELFFFKQKGTINFYN